MNLLRIALVQMDIGWENPAQNWSNLHTQLKKLQEKVDLIVLPEMFTTGFTMEPQRVAETMDGANVAQMVQLAQQQSAAIAGSLVIQEGGRYRNRLLFVTPEGEIHYYDKHYLFSPAGEDRVYQAGNRRIVLSYRGWRIAPFICYDLRFSLWTRSYQRAYDLALFVANWPQKRASHWKALLVARAIENQSFVVGVNRVGRDGNQLLYQGDSMAVDPLGRILWEQSHHRTIGVVELHRKVLETWWEQFPAWRDEDPPPQGWAFEESRPLLWSQLTSTKKSGVS